MNQSMREELLPITEEKIVTAFLREFIMNNPLGVPYNITREQIENAVEKLKKTVEKLPENLKIIKFQ
jgi:hypothetical protein